MTYRLRNILIALGLAVFAAILVSVYVTQYKNHVDSGQAGADVYVAARDIASGTPGDELIDGKYLRKESVRRVNVVRGAITDPKQIAARYVSEPIYEGDQLSLRRFGETGAEGARGQLTGAQRAMEIDAKPSQVLAGSLKTGDHVDVVATWSAPEGAHHVSKVVLRDILVLAAPDGGSSSSSVTGGDTGATVQLRVTDTQATKLFYLVKNGEWTLALRPPVRAGDSSETLQDGTTIAAEGVGGTVYQRAMQGTN
ncbi:MAG: Flp pilus assembly protein CpaB [Gaiellaceae bacterium]